jgi:hypothetical protein
MMTAPVTAPDLEPSSSRSLPDHELDPETTTVAHLFSPSPAEPTTTVKSGTCRAPALGMRAVEDHPSRAEGRETAPWWCKSCPHRGCGTTLVSYRSSHHRDHWKLPSSTCTRPRRDLEMMTSSPSFLQVLEMTTSSPSSRPVLEMMIAWSASGLPVVPVMPISHQALAKRIACSSVDQPDPWTPTGRWKLGLRLDLATTIAGLPSGPPTDLERSIWHELVSPWRRTETAK